MPTRPSQRLISLDAFRGLAIAGMVLVNSAGDWKAVYAPLLHAAWHGWTATDLVFPCFLFIVGVSMSLSLSARAAAGATRGALLRGLAQRSLVIFAIGLLLNLVPAFQLDTVRIPGVLQRIALCTLAAAPLVLGCGWRGLTGWLLGLLALHALLLLAVPVPDAKGAVAAGALEPGRDIGAWLDRQLLGRHLWSATRTWDPEGLLGTLSATGTLLFGALTGRWLGSPRPALEQLRWLLLAGLALLALGTALDRVLMPINKNLWTPSYAVFMAGWALLLFGSCFGLLDAPGDGGLRRASRWLCRPLVVFGVNALALYTLSVLLAKLLVAVKPGDGSRSLKQMLYAHIQALPLAPRDASLLWAMLFVALMFAVAWVMWRRRWFIKA